jgi:uncharacterized protein
LTSSPPTLHNLPLFPLGQALFPQGRLSLRLFEVRYLSMMRKCQEVGAPFGVVLLIEGSEVRQPGQSERFHDVGTLATIDELSNVQAGLMHAQCSGVSRFRILEQRCLPSGLWVADVEQIPRDAFVVIPQDLDYIARALQKISIGLQAQGTLGWDAQQAQFDDCAWVANRWCELLPVKPELKQALMATPSPLMRLELVGDILDRLQISPRQA